MVQSWLKTTRHNWSPIVPTFDLASQDSNLSQKHDQSQFDQIPPATSSDMFINTNAPRYLTESQKNSQQQSQLSNMSLGSGSNDLLYSNRNPSRQMRFPRSSWSCSPNDSRPSQRACLTYTASFEQTFSHTRESTTYSPRPPNPAPPAPSPSPHPYGLNLSLNEFLYHHFYFFQARKYPVRLTHGNKMPAFDSWYNIIFRVVEPPGLLMSRTTELQACPGRPAAKYWVMGMKFCFWDRTTPLLACLHSVFLLLTDQRARDKSF
jgi:hypothetical protein